jgi:transposase
MKRPVIIGLDLSEAVLRVQGVDALGRAVPSGQLRRSQVLASFGRLGPYRVGIEACPGACHRARELGAPGRETRLMLPAYVRP